MSHEEEVEGMGTWPLPMPFGKAVLGFFAVVGVDVWD